MTATHPAGAAGPRAAPAIPRLGCLGIGWIGRHRMEAIHRSGAAAIAMIADASDDACAAAAECVPGAVRVDGLDELLAAGLDGIVIATPSALHAEQAIAALQRGVAVFCQKPLGRTAAEVERVVQAARAADRLLGVDLSYRHTAAMRAIRELVAAGELGDVYAADLTFHNAYGPDKPWFYDVSLSGGGCVMDLGVHLVDLALWTLGFPAVERVESRLYSKGRALPADAREVEDYAIARIDLAGGASVRIACSWNLSAGRDAVIEAALYGTAGAAAMRNVDGSFYDFTAERYRGTSAKQLAAPPDEWGGRAAVEWAERLAAGAGFDPEAERLVDVAAALDAVYRR
jgi:predicted dehydrogenase